MNHWPVGSRSVSATASNAADRATGALSQPRPSRPACAAGKQPGAEYVGASCTPTWVSLDVGTTFDMPPGASNLRAAGRDSTHADAMVDAVRSAATESVAAKTDLRDLELRRKIRLRALFAGPRLLFAMVKFTASAQPSALTAPGNSISTQSGGRPERRRCARTQSASLVR